MTDETTTSGDDGGKLLYCSFCGKSQHEVRKLIAGPSVFICDECVDLCNDIIREEVQESSNEKAQDSLPTPREIKGILDEYVIGQKLGLQQQQGSFILSLPPPYNPSLDLYRHLSFAEVVAAHYIMILHLIFVAPS